MKRKATAPAIPPFDNLTEKQLRSIGQKFDKLQDPNGFKHINLLWKHHDRAKPLLWHLVRHGLALAPPTSSGPIRMLVEELDGVTAADVIGLLRRLPADMGALDRGQARESNMLTPGVLADVDALIVHAWRDDRAALLAARAELPESLQLAIDFVRRRAGEAIEPAAAGRILAHMIAQHAQRGLSWVDLHRVDGEPDVDRLEDDRLRALAGLFGPPGAWAEGLLEWVRRRVKVFRGEADGLSQRTLDGLRLAGLSDLVYLFGDGWWSPPTLLRVLDARDDSPESLFAAAARLAREGTAPFRIMVEQVAPEPAPAASGDDDEDGGDDDYGSGDDDDYSDGYGGGEPEVEDPEIEDIGPDSDRLRSLATVLTVVGIERTRAAVKSRAGARPPSLALPPEIDERFDLDRISDSEVDYLERLRAALAELGPKRAHAVVRRLLAKQFYFGKTAAIADVCFDPQVVDEVLTRLDAADYIDAALFRLGEPPLVPLLVAHADQHANPQRAGEYREAVLLVLARAASTGKLDPALDEHIHLDQIRFAHGGSRVDSVLAMLDVLPAARHAAVLRRNLERCAAEPWRLARCLRADTPPDLVAEILAALVARPGSVTNGSLGQRLRTLGAEIVAPLRRAFADAPPQGALVRELERALDPAVFEQFTKSLGQPLETKEQELQRLAAALPGPKVRIYLLSRLDRAPTADEVGRIAGRPRGVTAPPTHGDEPMVHMLTLDLAQIPELSREHHGARALSLYLPDPDDAELHDRGELVWTSEAELARDPGDAAGASAVGVTAVDVPTAIFDGRCEGDLDRVRGLVHASHGFARGGPMWLQTDAEGMVPGFLFQLDEGLCDLNLGDCGVLYVFDHDIAWQCH